MPAAAIYHMSAVWPEAERLHERCETHFGEGRSVHLCAGAERRCHDAKRSVFQGGRLFLVVQLERQYREP